MIHEKTIKKENYKQKTFNSENKIYTNSIMKIILASLLPIIFVSFTTGFLTPTKPRLAKNVLCKIFEAASKMPFNAGPYECQTNCQSQAEDNSPVLMHIGCTKKIDLTILPPGEYIYYAF